MLEIIEDINDSNLCSNTILTAFNVVKYVPQNK